MRSLVGKLKQLATAPSQCGLRPRETRDSRETADTMTPQGLAAAGQKKAQDVIPERDECVRDRFVALSPCVSCVLHVGP